MRNLFSYWLFKYIWEYLRVFTKLFTDIRVSEDFHYLASASQNNPKRTAIVHTLYMCTCMLWFNTHMYLCQPVIAGDILCVHTPAAKYTKRNTLSLPYRSTSIYTCNNMCPQELMHVANNNTLDAYLAIHLCRWNASVNKTPTLMTPHWCPLSESQNNPSQSKESISKRKKYKLQ